MLESELVNLVHRIVKERCERQDLELKAAASGVPQRLYDTLSAFSNQAGGGVIIFGIDEKKDYEICGVYDAQDLQAKVTEQALQMEPVVRPVFTVVSVSGRMVVSAEIAECDIFDKPCFYRGAGRLRGSFIRSGEADLPMTEYEVYSYEAFRRNIQDELRAAERADTQSFSREMLTEYFLAIRRHKPNLAGLPEDRILALQGMTDGGHPTVAGIMLLGEYPQAFFPQLSITAVSVDGYEIGDVGSRQERFIDNQRIEGCISQMLDGAMSFIRRNTRTSVMINEEGVRSDRTEYPMKAVREIVLNALVHRDYSRHTDHSPIRIMLFRDRLVVENPGGLYGRLAISDLGKAAADTRNPFIAGALEVMAGTENRFSGIPTVVNEMAAAGLPPAVFESSRGVFRVTLYNGCGRDHEDGSQMLSERILDYCSVPRSREEIASFLDLGTSSYAMRRYVMPLVEEGKLFMTLPDVPRSSRQRYIAGRR